jgi:hypothetical protein
MSSPELIVGGIVIPLTAALEISQEYQAIKSVSARRMGSGRLFRQKHWRKWATTIHISAAWIPAGLQTLDFDADLQIACIEPRSCQSATNAITLPSARRTDHPLRGFAIVGNDLIPCEVELDGHVATVAEVEGATGYRVNYLPLLVCSVDLTEQLDTASATYSWTLECEEV